MEQDVEQVALGAELVEQDVELGQLDVLDDGYDDAGEGLQD